MEEYKSNSNVSKEIHKYDKVITGTAEKKPKNKFLEAFVQDDISNVKNHIVSNVLIPALKSALYDAVSGGFKMFLFGERGAGYKRTSTPGATVEYHKYSANSTPNYSTPRISGGYGYSDPTFSDYGDAEAVLLNIQDVISQGGIISILDLYDMSGLQTIPNDAKYGWTDIRTAHIDRTFDGRYVLKMPRPLPID